MQDTYLGRRCPFVGMYFTEPRLSFFLSFFNVCLNFYRWYCLKKKRKKKVSGSSCVHNLKSWWFLWFEIPTINPGTFITSRVFVPLNYLYFCSCFGVFYFYFQLNHIKYIYLDYLYLFWLILTIICTFEVSQFFNIIVKFD